MLQIDIAKTVEVDVRSFLAAVNTYSVIILEIRVKVKLLNPSKTKCMFIGKPSGTMLDRTLVDLRIASDPWKLCGFRQIDQSLCANATSNIVIGLQNND